MTQWGIQYIYELKENWVSVELFTAAGETKEVNFILFNIALKEGKIKIILGHHSGMLEICPPLSKTNSM